ncbi:hypothetical protein CRG98_021661 [Punica granatum]|uniref:Mitochondrial protein n=1 Tax=Punica granatum TaxID=22663 RepID=A0A2I0JR28_PUNGR|nr:hypothetical protein CRG98_021661 [Punica granatum]
MDSHWKKSNLTRLPFGFISEAFPRNALNIKHHQLAKKAGKVVEINWKDTLSLPKWYVTPINGNILISHEKGSHIESSTAFSTSPATGSSSESSTALPPMVSSAPQASMHPMVTRSQAATIGATSSASKHSMVTRSQAGFIKPNPKYANIVVSSLPLEPRTVKSAFKHPGWKSAMLEELDALHRNKTWDLVPR